ncbi:hypothetical protein OEA41_004007 [Lepraria neglecta]|uniref:Uncharacterized protein n=1 Tax=Lepraria neglecta TaxID=209136 RepID=A0AAD9Z9G2_9LECA|nr:hypothetical protein OEA41_004007 [Lepraria neglecta]
MVDNALKTLPQEQKIPKKSETMPHSNGFAIANNLALASSSSTLSTIPDDRMQAHQQVQHYARKVIHFRIAQIKIEKETKVIGALDQKMEAKDAFLEALVGEGWYAKAVTGNFLPEEVLRMIVKDGYSWHYPIPLPPLPDSVLVEMKEMEGAGCEGVCDWLSALAVDGKAEGEDM